MAKDKTKPVRVKTNRRCKECPSFKKDEQNKFVCEVRKNPRQCLEEKYRGI
jgi:hypothetical protein